jgi:hypothetical protein
MNMKQRQTCCNPNLREPPAYPSIIVNAMEAVANTNKTPAYPSIIMNAMEAVANTNGMTNRGNKFVVLLLVAKIRRITVGRAALAVEVLASSVLGNYVKLLGWRLVCKSSFWLQVLSVTSGNCWACGSCRGFGFKFRR